MKLRKRYWETIPVCVFLKIKYIKEDMYVWLAYDVKTGKQDFSVGVEYKDDHVEEKDVPEMIKEEMLEYVESEFFEIDLYKFIESEKEK